MSRIDNKFDELLADIKDVKEKIESSSPLIC